MELATGEMQMCDSVKIFHPQVPNEEMRNEQGICTILLKMEKYL